MKVLAAAALASLLLGPAQARAEPVIVALGDSLTAGLGVAADEAYPARLEARLRSEGYAWRVINAGVSGDTTAGGLRRLDWVLRPRPAIVLVALGANDGLRGQSPRAMRANLEAIVRRLRAAGARVLLAGMRLPPNYGEDYTREFAAVFPEVARRAHVAFVPFPLDVVTDRRLVQPDGLHPNAAGHQAIADRLWPALARLLPPRGSRPRRAAGRGRTRPRASTRGGSTREAPQPVGRSPRPYYSCAAPAPASVQS